jgi:hypothetical protein
MLGGKVGGRTLKRWRRVHKNKRQMMIQMIGLGIQDIREVVVHDKGVRNDLPPDPQRK